MMVGTVSNCHHQKEIKVSAVSGMDFLMITFIGRQQLDFVTGSSVLGVTGVPILPVSHYALKHMFCSSFLLVLFVFCLPYPIRFRFQNQVFCKIMN